MKNWKAGIVAAVAIVFFGGAGIFFGIEKFSEQYHLERIKRKGVFSTALNGSAHDLEMLLRLGFDPNEKASDGRTGLSTIVAQTQIGEEDDESYEKAVLLLRYGADPSERGAYSRPPIVMARLRNLKKYIELLEPYLENKSFHGTTAQSPASEK